MKFAEEMKQISWKLEAEKGVAVKFHGTRRKFILGEVSKIKTVTICGSMKFAEEMKQISWKLEAEKGVAVIQCVYNEQNEPIPEEVQKR